MSVRSAWQTEPDLLEKYRAKADPANPRRNPVHEGMVQSLDEGVGRLMKALDENGLADNTIAAEGGRVKAGSTRRFSR